MQQSIHEVTRWPSMQGAVAPLRGLKTSTTWFYLPSGNMPCSTRRRPLRFPGRQEGARTKILPKGHQWSCAFRFLQLEEALWQYSAGQHGQPFPGALLAFTGEASALLQLVECCNLSPHCLQGVGLRPPFGAYSGC